VTLKPAFHHLLTLLEILFIIALGVSCRNVNEAALTSVTVTPSTPLMTVAQETTAPTLTPIPATLIASPTATALPTSTPPPTWTPRPTLPPAEAEAVVADLLTHNAGCQLPCWWGFTPGQTTWQTAGGFLATVSLRTTISDGPSNDFSIDVMVPVPTKIFPTPLTHYFYVKNGIVERMNIFPGYSTAYSLTAILGTYGQPAEVWLLTMSDSPDGTLPFNVSLFYPEQGILVEYSDSKTTLQGDRITSCPQKVRFPSINLWAPELKITSTEAFSWRIGNREKSDYRPLEEATGMDVQSFYETFKKQGNSVCLETPVDLWPFQP